MEEEQIISAIEKALSSKPESEFSWQSLVPTSVVGKVACVVAVLLLGGSSAKDVVMVGRGMLGLPTAIVDVPMATGVQQVSDDLQTHRVLSDKHFDRIEDEHYEYEKKNERNLQDIQESLDIHTTQLDTIISMRTGGKL